MKSWVEAPSYLFKRVFLYLELLYHINMDECSQFSLLTKHLTNRIKLMGVG
jgi:hypothetical protein